MVVKVNNIHQYQMRRLLGNSLIKYNYLKNFKKPIVQMPTTTPPKYIYVVEYHPMAMPDFDMKFKDHVHFDDWFNLYYGEEDKYTFQFSGQWWDHVSVFARLVILVNALALWISLEMSGQERKEKHLPGVMSSYLVGDSPGTHPAALYEN